MPSVAARRKRGCSFASRNSKARICATVPTFHDPLHLLGIPRFPRTVPDKKKQLYCSGWDTHPVCARRGLFSAEAMPAARTENRMMKVVNRRKSYQQPPATAGKKAEGKKRKSPCTPFREKGKGKETRRRFLWNAPRPRGRAYAREAAALLVHLRRGRRGGAGDHRQLLRHLRERLSDMGVVLPTLRPAAHRRPGVLLRLLPAAGRGEECRHRLPVVAPPGVRRESSFAKATEDGGRCGMSAEFRKCIKRERDRARSRRESPQGMFEASHRSLDRLVDSFEDPSKAAAFSDGGAGAEALRSFETGRNGTYYTRRIKVARRTSSSARRRTRTSRSRLSRTAARPAPAPRRPRSRRVWCSLVGG